MPAKEFDKYTTMGAYHWKECDRRSWDFNPPLVARYEMIARRVNCRDVLDLGAGDGYLSSLVASRCHQVVALEADADGVAQARQMLSGYPNVRVEQGSAYAIPYPPESFDVVMMADVIEHLEAPENAVAEVTRVLKQDGVALVTTPKWRADRVWDTRHVKEYTPSDFKGLLASHFECVEMRYAWPQRWSDCYRTPLGWRIIKLLGRLGVNLFGAESTDPNGFCQMLAIARRPLVGVRR